MDSSGIHLLLSGAALRAHNIMAIAFDSSSSGVATSGTTLSFSHTCASGAGLYVFVQDGASGSDTVTSVTYNAVSLTKIADVSGANNGFVTLWFIPNPATGTNTILITRTSSTNGIGGASESLIGTSLTQPDANIRTADTGGNISTFTGSVTSTVANAWIIWYTSATDNGGTATAGTATTLRNQQAVTGIGTMGLFDSNTPVGGAGAQSLIANSSSSGHFVGMMVSISPALSSKGNFLAFM